MIQSGYRAQRREDWGHPSYSTRRLAPEGKQRDVVKLILAAGVFGEEAADLVNEFFHRCIGAHSGTEELLFTEGPTSLVLGVGDAIRVSQ